MSISPVHGTALGEKEQKWFCDFSQQWTDLFGRCNWYDITLIHLGGESCPYTGRCELVAWFFGFGFTLTYIYDHSFNDAMVGLKDRIKGELEGRTGMKVKDPLGVLDALERRDNAWKSK
jgi:hypothetical protein